MPVRLLPHFNRVVFLFVVCRRFVLSCLFRVTALWTAVLGRTDLRRSPLPRLPLESALGSGAAGERHVCRSLPRTSQFQLRASVSPWGHANSCPAQITGFRETRRMRTLHPLPAAPALEILKQRQLCDSEKAELDSFPGTCLRSSTWEPRP